MYPVCLAPGTPTSIFVEFTHFYHSFSLASGFCAEVLIALSDRDMHDSGFVCITLSSTAAGDSFEIISNY